MENLLLPRHPFQTLALSLSGGGYRAAAFHLGTMAYLDKVKYDGVSLLQRVKVLSSVSGGSFTNAAYATTIQKGGTFKQCYDHLYGLMKNVDLVDEALGKLEDKNWKTYKTKNLINAFADIYHERFFTDLFDVFWNGKPNHLQEVIFNTTEFSKGLPFRFQKTSNDKGFIGNYFFQIPLPEAQEVKIADIVAASSCFPGGFEPIVFPLDFQHQQSPQLNSYAKELGKKREPGYPMSIMDGGILDNQGIGSVILAEKRLRTKMDLPSTDQKAIDLFIVSDVAGPGMDPLVNAEPYPLKGWRSWSFKGLRTWGVLLFLISLVNLLGIFLLSNKWGVVGLTILGTLTGVLGIVFSFLGGLVIKRVPGWFQVPPFFTKHLGFFHRIKFGVYKNMIIPRKDSAIKMISEVFLKQIRRLSYKRLYDNPDWQKRVFMNAVYELEKEKVEERKKSNKSAHMSKETLEPGPEIERVSSIAASMGTTLWFTPGELEGPENKLDSLVACGNYNICYNLLAYIEKLRAEEAYETLYPKEVKYNIDQLYDHLLEDWKRFKKDPFWMMSAL